MMHRTNLVLELALCSILAAGGRAVAQNSPPVVTNVTAAQRPDASRRVDIGYDLADAEGDPCMVWVMLSNDGGASWGMPAFSLTGDLGEGILPGAGKAILWDAGADLPGAAGSFKLRVYADDGNGPGASMVAVPGGPFPYQNGALVPVPTFLIDKYEVTNTRYCAFLNDADPNGDHWDASMEITQHGVAGSYYYGVVSGRGNYPIRYVSRLDAEAFAAWRSSFDGLTYRLPTEQEWEKAAAWDPVLGKHWGYAFQSDAIDCNRCNYNTCVGGATEVGSYNGTGSTQDSRSYYGCYDMTGNVWEWTSSNSWGSGVLRGGSWGNDATGATTTNRITTPPGGRYSNVGFRLLLDLP